MLDAFIIEEIKRQEQEQGRDDRPSISIELPVPVIPDQRSERDDDDRPGGVVIIDYA